MKVAVLGAGNAGCAIAAHLKRLNNHVFLYDIVEDQLATIKANDNTITITGKIDVSGDAKIDIVTGNITKAVENAELIVCATPAHAHKFLAADLAPHLKANQIILLYPGRTGGVLEFKKILNEKNGPEVLIVESQTILYVCRRADATVNIFGIKNKVPCAGLPKSQLSSFFDMITPFFPQFEEAPSIWSTSFENIGMLFHPTPTLLNLGRMESNNRFDYYTDGISPSIADLIEVIDKERLAVASALGVTLPTAIEWLDRSYNAKGDTLFEALQNNIYYKGVSAPYFASREAKLSCRYVIEDVPTGLVPTSEIGKKFGIATPATDMIIQLAEIMFQKDFRAEGRNLRQLGLENMSPDAIRTL